MNNLITNFTSSIYIFFSYLHCFNKVLYCLNHFALYLACLLSMLARTVPIPKGSGLKGRFARPNPPRQGGAAVTSNNGSRRNVHDIMDLFSNVVHGGEEDKDSRTITLTRTINLIINSCSVLFCTGKKRTRIPRQ